MWSEILTMIFNATMIGMGTAIGNYVATNHLLEKLKLLKSKKRKGTK